MKAIPTSPSAYTVALSSHQKTNGVTAWRTPTTIPHRMGARSARGDANEVIAGRATGQRSSATRRRRFTRSSMHGSIEPHHAVLADDLHARRLLPDRAAEEDRPCALPPWCRALTATTGRAD